MRLSYSRRARFDPPSIHAYIAQDSERSADRMLLQLTDACAGLRDVPDQGRPGAAPGTRELVTVPPYVVDSVSDDGIEVASIHHGAQNR